MPADGPKPNDSMGPYFPSSVSTIPGNGRRWVPILVAIMFALWVVVRFLALLAV